MDLGLQSTNSMFFSFYRLNLNVKKMFSRGQFWALYSLLFMIVPSWTLAETINLSDSRSRARFFLSLLHRHPRIHALNQTFNRSLNGVFDNVPILVRDLHLNTSIWELTPMPVYGFSYLDSQAAQFDQNAVGEIRSELLRQAAHIFESLERKPRNFTLGELRNDIKSLANDDFLKSYLFLLPLLYDGHGHPRFGNLGESDQQAQLIERLNQLTGEDLHLQYGARMNSALALADGAVRHGIQSHINNFVRKSLEPKLHNHTLRTASLKFSMEEVHPLVALIRGAVGLDCSMNSVGYHALIPGAKVFFIRDSHNLRDDPIGYAFVAPGAPGFAPLLLTAQGPGIKPRYIRPIIKALHSIYESDRVYLPTREDMEASWLVESPSIMDAFSAEGQKKVYASLQAATWELLDHALESRNMMPYENYYVHPRSKLPLLLRKETDLMPKINLGASHYYETEFKHLPLWERMKLVARLSKYTSRSGSLQTAAREILNLNEAQYQFAREVLLATRNRIPRPEVLARVREVGLAVEDLLRLPSAVAALALSEVVDWDPTMLEDQEWVAVVQRALEKLDSEIQHLKKTGRKAQSIQLIRATERLGNRRERSQVWLELHRSFENKSYEQAIRKNLDLIRSESWTIEFIKVLTHAPKLKDRELAWELTVIVHEDKNQVPLLNTLLRHMTVSELVARFINNPKMDILWERILSQAKDLSINDLMKLHNFIALPSMAPIQVHYRHLIQPFLISEINARPPAWRSKLLESLTNAFGLKSQIAQTALSRSEPTELEFGLSLVEHFDPQITILLANLYDKHPEHRSAILNTLVSAPAHKDASQVWMALYLNKTDLLEKKILKSILQSAKLWNQFHLDLWKDRLLNFMNSGIKRCQDLLTSN